MVKKKKQKQSHDNDIDKFYVDIESLQHKISRAYVRVNSRALQVRKETKNMHIYSLRALACVSFFIMNQLIYLCHTDCKDGAIQ